MALNAAAVGESITESGEARLFTEWLGKWFDGAAHTVGNKPAVVFPRASIEFGQSKTEQPLDGVEIRMIPDASSGETLASENGRQLIEPLTLLFWVKANVRADKDVSSKSLASKTAELLSSILKNPKATKELSQKGIHDLRARKPRPIADDKYGLQLVVCRCRVIYEVKFS